MTGYDAALGYNAVINYDGGAGVITIADPAPAAAPVRSLSAVRHVIHGPAGMDVPVIAGDWAADEEAPGGYHSASGWLDSDRVFALPGVYQAGAVWTIYADDGAVPLWEGNLLDHTFSQDGRTELLGRGWGQIPDRSAGRLLFWNNDYTDWVPCDSDPHNYSADNSVQVDLQGGRIRLLVPAHANVANSDQNRALFWAEGAPIDHIDFTASVRGFTNYALRVLSAIGPAGTSSQEGGDITASGTYSRDINNIPGADQVALQLIRTGGADTSTADQTSVTITNLHVRANGTSTAGAATDFVVRAVVAAAGSNIDTWDVQSTGDIITPLDFKTGTYADALDYCSNFYGWPWLILSRASRKYCRFRMPDTWFTSRNEGLTQLDPVTKYNHVTVRYEGPSGRQREVTAKPSDIGVPDPFAATGFISTMTIELSLPGRHTRHHVRQHRQIDNTIAQSVARRVLGVVIQERYTGSLNRAFLHDQSGRLVDARTVRAGDYINIVDGKPFDNIVVQTMNKSIGALGASFQLVQHDPVLDRYFLRHKLTEM